MTTLEELQQKWPVGLKIPRHSWIYQGYYEVVGHHCPVGSHPVVVVFAADKTGRSDGYRNFTPEELQPPEKEKTMTGIKVGEKYELRKEWPSTGGPSPVEITRAASWAVRYKWNSGLRSVFSECEKPERFLTKYQKVDPEPDIQVGDVLRDYGGRPWVVFEKSERNVELMDGFGSSLFIEPSPLESWERTDYKVPVLREGQWLGVSYSGGVCGGDPLGSAGPHVVINKGGRLVFSFYDYGKTVELPCPTAKELW